MAPTGTVFRATQWDPTLILSQIVCLQAIWYVSISTIVFTLFKFSGTDITLDAILNYREIRADNAQGMLLSLAWLLNSLVGVYLLLKIVTRARLVLDFSLTLLLYHVVLTTLYSDHVPSTFLWWALNGTTCGIMIFGGEYVCMQQEMEPIVLGGGLSGSNNNNSNNNSNGAAGSSSAGGSSGSGNNNSSSIGGGSGINSGDGHGTSGLTDSDSHAFESESAGLLMQSFDASNPEHGSSHTGPSGPSRSMPHKARSSEDSTVIRGSFKQTVRSSILGGQSHGRQRTSDRYEMLPVNEHEDR
ncbi:hypothetical protein BGW38_010337 [Lunasporangiospora selenospora]|uniref:Integral membrane protein S linking to the trans Golgi network-domain-containing protein n=1 Tax=Lunasporangiospora selenospora TaxID=979761 RepID=A0A9P6KFJ9_9FUNG|nr:hypothetical protein BGW38_010337 [Lunasporangiospora selenospora]